MKGGFSERIVDSIQHNLDTFEPDNRVLVRIVQSFQNGSTKKTQVQLNSRLRWDLFSKYWEWLKCHEFIIMTNNDESKNDYKLTARGNELFSLFQRYYEFLHKNNELPQLVT
jgi:predicted transcriptional regulator